MNQPGNESPLFWVGVFFRAGIDPLVSQSFFLACFSLLLRLLPPSRFGRARLPLLPLVMTQRREQKDKRRAVQEKARFLLIAYHCLIGRLPGFRGLHKLNL
jgi:hypothetical protein